VNTQLNQLSDLFPDMNARIVAIVREGRRFVPKSEDQMFIGDEVFFVAEAPLLKRVLSSFGHNENKAQSIVIVGGGNIGLSLVNKIRESNPNITIKLIEQDTQRAIYLSENLEDVLILNASGLDQNILAEANISSIDTLIAVTEDDETNILVSLLARQYGCGRVIPLVNKEAYNALTGTLGLGAVVSPKAITASTVMRHVRRGRVKAIHNILGDFAEILEITATDSTSILNRPIKDIDLPKDIYICSIIRDGQVILPSKENVIKKNDHVVILAKRDQACKVEKLFSAQVDIF